MEQFKSILGKRIVHVFPETEDSNPLAILQDGQVVRLMAEHKSEAGEVITQQLGTVGAMTWTGQQYDAIHAALPRRRKGKGKHGKPEAAKGKVGTNV